MKRLFLILTIFSSIFFNSCLSTNTSDNTFSTEPKEKSYGMVIFTDKFLGTKTATHRNIYMDFTSGVSESLYFEPFFVYNEDTVTFYLKVQFEYFGNFILTPEKIVLLGENGRIIVNITEAPEIGENILGSGSALGRRNIITVREKISKKDYIQLSDFFDSNKRIRLGLYTSGNKAKEFTEQSTRAHIIFSDAYTFYKDNLEDKFDSKISDHLIFQ